MASLLLLAAAACLTLTLPAQDPTWRKESSLLWSQDKRDIAYRNIEKIYNHRTVKASGKLRPLLTGKPLKIDVNIDGYMKSQHAAGLLILHDEKIVLEKYARGYTSQGRWLSQSMAKSITSTLIGAAIQDAAIKSLDDPITKDLPEMKGSGYDGVTLRQVLTMTSGVRWNEDYTDVNSDVAKYSLQEPEDGMDAAVTYMRKLPRQSPPGQKWLYNSGETNLIGSILYKATGNNLSEYLAEKIWQPYGMEQDAIWQLGRSGAEISGCCIAVSLRDYARFGQFVLDGGKVNGKQVIDPAYLKLATSKQADIGIADRGYGFQWWTFDDGSFNAAGIFGQSIYIDPARRLVRVTSGNWPTDIDRETLQPAHTAVFRKIQSALK